MKCKVKLIYQKLANSSTSLLCQSAHQGCAGIGRQLHPLKVKDLIKDKVLGTKGKNICGAVA